MWTGPLDGSYPVASWEDWQHLCARVEQGDLGARQVFENYMKYWNAQVRQQNALKMQRGNAPLYYPGTTPVMFAPGGAVALKPPSEEWLPPVIQVPRGALRELAEIAARHGIGCQYNGREIAPYVTPQEEEEKAVVPRIGDEQRNRSLEHLGEMLATGYLNQNEYDTRSAAALNAKTQGELDVLVKDLPPLPEKRIAEPAAKKKDPAFRKNSLVASGLFTAATAFAATTPGINVIPVVVLGVLAVFWFSLLVYSVWKR